jgi:DNA-binding MarR family transcriptional regulator
MPDVITPVELAAYAALKQAVVSVRLNLGKHLRHLGGVSLVQFEILFLLEHSPGGLRMHEIAEAVGLSRSGLTYQVGQLEELGWVRRSQGESNSRAVVATLTEAGRERVSGLQDEHFAFVRGRAFGLLSEDELLLMTSILQRIAAGTEGAE